MSSDWRIVPGYPDYLVHVRGGVFSLKRGKAKEIKPNYRDDGYARIALFNQDGRKQFYHHEIVALAFHGPRPEGYYIDHINKDKSDCSADNLEYVTRSESAKRITR